MKRLTQVWGYICYTYSLLLLLRRWTQKVVHDTNIIYNYTIIFNNLLNYSLFPDSWKKAKVVAILKKNKDIESPASYRPISLLPNISKIFEIIINDRIARFCKENDIIPECQFGFQPRHSTIHALNRLTSDINWALNNKQCVHV